MQEAMTIQTDVLTSATVVVLGGSPLVSTPAVAMDGCGITDVIPGRVVGRVRGTVIGGGAYVDTEGGPLVTSSKRLV